MYQSTSKAEQFYNRSGSESTKGSRKGYSLLGEGENPTSVLSEDQKMMNERASLVARKMECERNLHLLNLEIRKESMLRTRRFKEALNERDAVKVELTGVMAGLSAIKSRRESTAVPGRVESHFMDICREIMTRGQFRILFDQARERAEKDAE